MKKPRLELPIALRVYENCFKVGAPLAAAPATRRSRQRERMLLAFCTGLLLLATIPPLINLGRYQRRLAGAISRSLGRPVAMDAISLRLIPWPALEIANLSVSEQPEFGAEPALFAPEVTAELRLSSLWRGRFELSRVEITDASVNLVRAKSGRWNISSVLLQASRVQSAPTTQTRPGRELRFPLIEATATRINLKREEEKLPYSLLNADFSMVLARPGVWQLRLQGQPDRTDLQLSPGDTGTVRLEGELHRASALGSMPLALHGEWKHAPLGQLSELLFGADAGWRGDMDATTDFSGDVDHLQLSMRLLAANLHRQEFTPEQPLTLMLRCQGTYLRAAGSFHPVECTLPLGSGRVLLRQDTASGESQWTLAAERVPASAISSLFSTLGPETPAPGAFTGEINGAVGYRRTTHELTGAFTSDELAIAHGALDGLPLRLTGVKLTAAPEPGGKAMLLSADPVTLGAAGKPVLLSGELTHNGYALHAGGEATLPALEAAAAGLHLPSLSAFAPGVDDQSTVLLGLTSTGHWSLHELPEPPKAHTSGLVQLHHVQWRAPWLPVPIQFSSLNASFSPGMVRWSTTGATLGDGNRQIELAGDAELPLGCDAELLCTAHFNLRTASLDAAGLQAALSGGHEPLLSSLLNRLHGSQGSFPALEGLLHAEVLTVGRLPIRNTTMRMATTFSAGGDSVQLETMDGQALGGSLHLHGLISFPGGKPTYALKVPLTGANAAQAAALWHESWGPGTMEGDAELLLSGRTAAELEAGASGRFRFSWLQGSLVPALPHFEGVNASGAIRPQGFALQHASLLGAATGTPMAVEGTVGWDRSLSLQLTGGEGMPVATLSGLLAAPELTPKLPQQR